MSIARRIRRQFGELQSMATPAASATFQDYQRSADEHHKANRHGLPFRLLDVFTRVWHLGFTAFGGPPVHFGIIHRRYVDGAGGLTPWLSEQTYQELFAICQALPGPGSTKMLFCTVFIHAGLTPAIFAFLLWSLPGAIGMFLLALGVRNIGETLPGPVYALLSGLNASTVGVIALAAVQLASKAITDPLTRVLVIGSACAGLCYTSLWYFPLLMAVGGISTMLWDIWLSRLVGRAVASLHRRRQPRADKSPETVASQPIELQELAQDQAKGLRARAVPSTSRTSTQESTLPRPSAAPALAAEIPDADAYSMPVWAGITIIVLFFASFIAVLVARGLVSPVPLPLDLFASMYLAGTIIFGGGPVVIPLLREYVVQPGWVSSRDFLIGLAIIQAFPGPNFNFAVYLSALAIQSSPSMNYSSLLGAVLGFAGIFLPGLTLALGVQGMWRVLRTKPAIVSALRGINAAAVGLVFTAVYRLWQIGYLMPGNAQGQSLGLEPWWVAVAAIAYSANAWFGVPAAFAIIAGAVLGLLWYAVAGRAFLG